MVSSVKIKIKKYSASEFKSTDDHVAVEEPLEIGIEYGGNKERINKIISVTMRTPGNDEELAAGFLFTEGILKSSTEILKSDYLQSNENKTVIRLNENVMPDLKNSERNFYTTSSCGVCGKTSIDSVKTVSVYKDVSDNISISSKTLYGLTNELKSNQQIFNVTGGLHASVLFDKKGNIEQLREDVGRHNALDKLIGYYFINEKLPLTQKILFLSGRASFELVQKAMMAGIKIIVSVGAPSSLAVSLAEETGITLAGFLKKKSFNVYANGHRIMD
ncbi:MAG: formate dehydrogenase accessory sulfurtransferase FdhD [Ignavibacteria bacterium]